MIIDTDGSGDMIAPRATPDDGHEHRYELNPSSRGVGFDYECIRCGLIRNKRTIA